MLSGRGEGEGEASLEVSGIGKVPTHVLNMYV